MSRIAFACSLSMSNSLQRAILASAVEEELLIVRITSSIIEIALRRPSII